MTTLDLQINLSEGLLERLQGEAERRNVPLSEVVNLALEAYLDELTEEEILANFRQGLRDAFTGNYRPAREVLAELKDMRD